MTSSRYIDEYKSYEDKASAWIEIIKSKPVIKEVEQPAMKSLLNGKNFKSVLCLGSGTGEECQYFIDHKVKRVIGVEPAEKLVDYARANYPKVEFICSSMEEMSFSKADFDLIYASMSLHYIENLEPVINKISGLLTPGGEFVLSIIHPVFREYRLASGKVNSFADALNRLSKAKKSIIGGFKPYFKKRSYKHKIFGDFEVTQYAYPISDYFNMIIDNGLKIDRVLEPKLTRRTKDNYFNNIHKDTPAVLLISAKK